MNIIDLRPDLEELGLRVPENDPMPATAEKSGAIIHWPALSRDVGDDTDCIGLLLGFAAYHVAKNWASPFAPVFGGGIMYHSAVAPSGTVFLLRDPESILWHSGTWEGNYYRVALLALIGVAQQPTAAQLRSLRTRAEVYGPTDPHSAFTNTGCPGDPLRTWIKTGMPITQEEDDMTPEEVEAIVRKVLADDGYGNFVIAVNKRLAIDAHHTHDTGEPKEAA